MSGTRVGRNGLVRRTWRKMVWHVAQGGITWRKMVYVAQSNISVEL